MNAPGRPAIDPAGVLANPAFRRVWAAGASTAMIRWLDLLVLGVFTFELTDSAGKVAIAFLVRMLPRLLFGVPVGVLADRVDRKRLWVATLLALAVTSLVLAALIASGRIAYWHLLVTVFVAGLFWSIEFPTRRALIADIVRHDQIGRAVGLDWSTDSLAKMAGPALGGGLIVTTGAEGAYFVATGVFLAGAALAMSVRHERAAPASDVVPAAWRELRDGVRYVRASSLLVGALAVTIIFNLVFPAYNSLLPVIGKEILDANALRVGILGSLEGFGSLLGALWIASRAAPPDYARLYYYGTAWFLVCAFLFSQSEVYALSAAIVFALGFGFAAFATMQTTILVTATDPAMRGRVLGLLSLCIGAGPVGALQVGPLTSAVGDQAGLAIIVAEGGALMLLVAVVWPVIRRRASALVAVSETSAVDAESSA